MNREKKIIVYHPTGNMNTRAAIEGFRKKNFLYKFYTSIACFENSLLYRLSSLSFLKEFRRRMFNSSLKSITITFPWSELGRQISIKLNLSYFLRHEIGFFCIDKVYKRVDYWVSSKIFRLKKHICAVYTYEDCALRTFQKAKKNKIVCLYDLPTGYWRCKNLLLSNEIECNPMWAMTLSGFNDSEEKLRNKDKELLLADKIYVASTFTQKTLEYYPGKLADIEVIPYGFPPVNKCRTYTPFEGRKIKLLFVGGLSQSKGLSYLFDSIKGIEDIIDLTIIGRGNIESCPILKTELKKVNYIPSLPHDEVLKIMAEHDLFLFPSLFDGFGLVVTEAMSQGTPVITTDRTCGPDVITNGKDGWIVEAGNSQQIRNLLEEIIHNPYVLHEVGKNALHTASLRPWSCYERELSNSVERFIYGK